MTVPTSFRIAAVLTLALASTAFGQLPPGKDCYAFPAGAKGGQTVEVRLGGSDWTSDVQFFVYDPRVKLKVLAAPGEVLLPEPPYWFGIKSFNNDPRLPREAVVQLQIPTDMPPGPVRWGVANANGAGGCGLFFVGSGDEATENESQKGPVDLASLPVTVNGRLRRIEEVDRYRFKATATGLVTCDLAAQRLGNEFNGVLEVFDGETKIAEAVDTEGVDPVLTFAVEKGRSYTLAVRDVEYRGYRNFTYRLQLSIGPRLVTAVPPAGRRGDKRQVEFIGIGIATGKPQLERLTKEVAFPKDGESFSYRLETAHGTTQPFTFQLSDTADLLEPTDAKARRIDIPGAMVGRIERRGERDAYTLPGKKGEWWDVSVQAKQIGSSVDATLAVLGPDGKQLAANDDSGGGSDARVSLALPADGDYQIVVGDVSGKKPGLDAVYRLVIRRPLPCFNLRTTGIVNIPIGGKATLKVDLEREGGFKGPVTLALSGLPDGVTVPAEVVIPANAATLQVPLECAKTAGATASLVQITGKATIDDRPVTATAVVVNEEGVVSSILVATTMKPPFRVKSPDADNTRKVPRGSTHLADLMIERDEGFTGDIILDMAGSQSRHRQGIRGPVFTVTSKQDRIRYPVTAPEWLESTRTSRIALVAMSKIPDPKGTPRYVLAAMDGQITMSIEGALLKLSHTADEITVDCGESIDVPLKLARSSELTGAVKVELVVPPELAGLVSATSLEWPKDKGTATLRVVSKNDARLVGTWKLTARASGTREGYPVVSETEFEVEFTRPSR